MQTPVQTDVHANGFSQPIQERSLDEKLEAIRSIQPDPELDGDQVTFPSTATIDSAGEFLNFLKRAGRLPNDLKPSIVGGVGFTFWNHSRKVYIEFRNTGNAHALFSDGISMPRVFKVVQNEAGFQSVLNETESYLNEQVPTHSAGNDNERT